MSHKMKGQKIDLATFHREQPVDELMADLPSAPDPNREPYDRRRGGRGEGRGGGRFGDRDRERGYGREDRGGFDRDREREEGDGPSAADDDAGPWLRAGPSGRRDNRGGFDSGRENRGDRGFDSGRGDRGGFDRENRGDRGFDSGRGDRGGFDRENRGDRGGFDRENRGDRGFDSGRGGRGGFDRENRGDRGSYDRDRGNGRSDPLSAGERPKLNILPRSAPQQSSVESVTAKIETLTTQETPASNDKWDSIFKKPRNTGSSGADYRDSDRRGGGGGGWDSDRNKGGDYDRNREGDSGDRRGGSRGYGSERRGFASSNRYDTDPEPIDDPRFAGKFGSSSRPQSKPVEITSIPTIVVEKKEDPKAEERRAAQEEKKQLAAAKAEAEKKAREEQLSRKEKEIATLETQKNTVLGLVTSGVKGQALLETIKSSTPKPLGAALMGAILTSLTSFESVSWCSSEEYGSALSYLLVGQDREQMLAIYELQKYCHSHRFPKISTKSGPRSLLEIIFQLLYKNDVLEASGVLKWWDDEEFDEIPGRSEALVQVTTFVNWLNEEEEGDEEEDDDDDLEPPPRNAA